MWVSCGFCGFSPPAIPYPGHGEDWGGLSVCLPDPSSSIRTRVRPPNHNYAWATSGTPTLMAPGPHLVVLLLLGRHRLPAHSHSRILGRQNKRG